MLHNLFLSIAVALVSAPVAYAQVMPSAVPDPVQYTISPENPGPNQAVRIEVEGVGQFLGDSAITWKKNGVTVGSAQNQPSFSFTTGGLGASTVIDLTINSPTQGVITNKFVFTPSIINLIWEADTSAPLLYKGKPLYSAGSALKVVAFPTVFSAGSFIPANKLSFQWSRNGSPETAASGLGKHVFSFQGDQLQTEERVSVTVYSGTTAVGKGEVVIPATAPQVLLYIQDPLRGQLLGSALQANASLTQTEATFKAEPYFFANSSVKRGSLTYAWSLNGQEVTGPDTAKGLLTLRQTGEGGGAAQLSVSIQNNDSSKFVQSAVAGFDLVFGKQAGSLFSSFFGL